MSTLWAKTNIGLAVLAIFGFCFVNIVLSGAILQKNPLWTVFGYFLLVDWSSRGWELFAVLLPIASIAIVYLVDAANRDYREAVENNDRVELARIEQKLSWVERLVRLRFILTLAFWILVGAQTFLYLNSRGCWLTVPTNVRAWAGLIYGARTPCPICSRPQPADRGTNYQKVWDVRFGHGM